MGSSVVSREPWRARIEARSAVALRKELGRAMAAGELAAVGPILPVAGGGYGVDVLRLKERHVVPRWRKPVLVAGGVTLGIGGFAALGWWLVSATVSVASALSLPLIGTVAALAWLGFRALSSGSRSGSGCTTTVTITHRH